MSTRWSRISRSGEAGVTGMEAALTLMVFVVISTAFAAVALAAGVFELEERRPSVRAALEDASANVQVSGSLFARDVNADGNLEAADGDGLLVTLSLVAGGTSVSLDRTAHANRLVVNLVDSEARSADVSYTPRWVLGDGDLLLESGELAELHIPLPPGMALDRGEEFSLAIIPSAGGSLVVSRTIPVAIGPIVNLH